MGFGQSVKTVAMCVYIYDYVHMMVVIYVDSMTFYMCKDICAY